MKDWIVSQHPQHSIPADADLPDLVSASARVDAGSIINDIIIPRTTIDEDGRIVISYAALFAMAVAIEKIRTTGYLCETEVGNDVTD